MRVTIKNYVDKLDNPPNMDKSVETYNLPRLNHEEIENLNIPIMSKEVESLIKKFPMLKRPGPDYYTDEFCQTFQELIPILLKAFQESEEEGSFPNSVYKASITLIPKPDKDTTTKQNKTNKHKTIDQYH